MLITKHSPETIKRFRRYSFFFLPCWLIWLASMLWIPRAWIWVLFVFMIVFMSIGAGLSLSALASLRRDAKKSQHPDDDVAALIDGEIDIAEYGRRKDARSKTAGTP